MLKREFSLILQRMKGRNIETKSFDLNSKTAFAQNPNGLGANSEFDMLKVGNRNTINQQKYNFSQIQLEKREQIKNRKEKLKQNLVFETATFRCEKCQLTFTDNISYQEHLNGKSHNSKVHLQVKEATVESIKEKLLEKKRERDIQKLKEKE